MPIATWNPARSVWETDQEFACGHLGLYSETLPRSGSMRNGQLSRPQTLEPAISASGSSSSPGPGLLPTPAQGNFNDGESLESWERRRQRNLVKGVNGNGQGTPLAIAVQRLLPTPRAIDGRPKSNGPRQDSVTGMFLYDESGRRRDADERVELMGTPRGADGMIGEDLEVTRARLERGTRNRGTLEEDISLLKTPTAQLAVNGGSQHPDKRRSGGHGPTLADQAEWELLPTPAARDWRSGESNVMDRNARPLNEVIVNRLEEKLLPTPQVADVMGGHATRSGARNNEMLLPGVAKVLGRQANVDWGVYARAVVRWEHILGRLVPHPLEAGRKGKGRLAALFVEWMMGLPAGWVCDVPDLSRNAQLKALGNGVVPQQAALGIMVLLERLAGV